MTLAHESSPKKFNTLHRRVLGMEYFPIRFKISIRDLKCKKMQKNVLNEKMIKNVKNVLNEKMIKNETNDKKC